MKAAASLPQADTPPPDTLDVVLVSGFAALAGASLVAMLLAWFGLFRAIPVVAGSVAAGATAAWLAARSRPHEGRVLSLSVRARITIAVLILVGAGLYFTPARYQFDGLDGSMYVALSAILESHGSLDPVDTLAASIPETDRAILFPASASAVSLTPERFPGGLLLSPIDSRLRPEFLHLYPAWMAIAGLAMGPEARWFVNPVLAVLSLLLVWMLGRRLSGPFTGEVAAGLIAVNVAQIWFARFPSSEIPAQFLVLSGLYLTVLALDTDWRGAGAAAGSAFGLLAFTRIDMLVLVIPTVVLLLLMTIRRSGLTAAVLGVASAVGIVGGLGIAYAVTAAPDYSLRVVETAWGYAEGHPERAALALAVIAAMALSIVSALARPNLARRLWFALTPVALLLVAALLWRDHARGELQALITSIGTVTALAGVVAMVVGRRGWRAAPVALIFAAGLAYVGNPLDQRTLPWALRRYVPIVLPLALLGFAYFIRTTQSRWKSVPIWLAPIALGGWFLYNSWPIVRTPLMPHGSRTVGAVVNATRPDSFLIWDAGSPTHLALATHTAGRRLSLLAPYDRSASPVIRRTVASALDGGRPVYLIADERQGTTGHEAWGERLEGLALRPSGSVNVPTDRLIQGARPFGFWIEHTERRLHLYSIEREMTSPVPARIDIGSWDLAYLGPGFYPSEIQEGTAVRWTQSVATIRLPHRFVPQHAENQLVLRLATRRPGGQRVPLTVELDGAQIARLDLGAEFADYLVPLPAVTADLRALLTLRSTSFVPRDAGVGEDRRSLGVVVDWVELRAVPVRPGSSAAVIWPSPVSRQ